MVSSRLIFSLGLFMASLTAVSSQAKPPRPPYGSAHVDLGFTGATVIVKSTHVSHAPGSDHRVLTLITANGKRRVMALHDGGGKLGNNSLNLYYAGQDQFRLLSDKDCLDIDALGAKLERCALAPSCGPNLASGLVFLGRFDWMNGFDPPHGDFVYRFRFLPSYDATCGA